MNRTTTYLAICLWLALFQVHSFRPGSRFKISGCSLGLNEVRDHTTVFDPNSGSGVLFMSQRKDDSTHNRDPYNANRSIDSQRSKSSFGSYSSSRSGSGSNNNVKNSKESKYEVSEENPVESMFSVSYDPLQPPDQSTLERDLEDLLMERALRFYDQKLVGYDEKCYLVGLEDKSSSSFSDKTSFTMEESLTELSELAGKPHLFSSHHSHLYSDDEYTHTNLFFSQYVYRRCWSQSDRVNVSTSD